MESESHAEAEADVIRLLQTEEDLARLTTLRAEWAAKQTAVDNELSASLHAQVQELARGRATLEGCSTSATTFRQELAEIGALCAESTLVVERPELFRELATARTNIATTLDAVKDVLSLPEDASAAVDMIRDERLLAQAFLILAELELRMRASKSEVSSARDARRGEGRRGAMTLYGYFDDVEGALAKFENVLWRSIRRGLFEGEHGTSTMTRASQIVEMQEALDRSLAPDYEPKLWRNRCVEEMRQAIADRFQPVVSKVLDVQGEKLEELLEEAAIITDELTDIFDFIAPCFPAEGVAVFDVAVREMLHWIAVIIDSVATSDSGLSNAQILKVVEWHEALSLNVAALGVEEDLVQLPGMSVREICEADASGRESASSTNMCEPIGPAAMTLDAFLGTSASGSMQGGDRIDDAGDDRGRGLVKLMDTYIGRVRDAVARWCTSIVQADKAFSQAPRSRDDGRLWTPTAVDFFRLLNEQLSAVEGVTRKALLLKTAGVVVQGMLQLQDLQEQSLAEPLGDFSLELLVAIVNNNVHAYDLSQELGERVSDALDDTYRGCVDVEVACTGFLSLAKRAVELAREHVLMDPSFTRLFAALFVDETWASGETIANLVATLQDYLSDCVVWMDEGFFRRFAEDMLEHVAERYISALLTQCPGVTAEMIAHMERDDDALRELFGGFLTGSRCEAKLRVLCDFRELVASSDVEAFTLSFTMLLQNRKNTELSALEKLVAMRGDISRQERREILEQCKEVFEQRPHQLKTKSFKKAARAVVISKRLATPVLRIPGEDEDPQASAT
mmetsp:Transcript_8241/g.27390  ORF Transcript_8241/g.27390 Transcript_8241/m.27390 type:complete len:795 (-) Transcript_8241:3164-5548(-)